MYFCFQEDEKEDASTPESTPYVSNPMYESTSATSTPELPEKDEFVSNTIINKPFL